MNLQMSMRFQFSDLSTLQEFPTLQELPTLQESPTLQELPTLQESPTLQELPTLQESPTLQELPTLQESPTLQELPTLQESPTLQEFPTLQGWGNPPRVGVRSKGLTVWLLLVFLISGSLTTKAQERSVSHPSQQWMQVYTQSEITEKISILLDAGMRQTHNAAWPSQRLVRAGIGYGLPLNLQGVTGFARFSFQQDGRTSRLEWRLWQELNRTHSLRSGSFQQRLRAEGRFFEIPSTGGTKASHHFNMRFRYRLQAMIPIFKLGHLDTHSPSLLLSIADEIFLNTGKEIIHNTLDNNRFVVGPALRLNPGLTLALLYNHQYGHRSLRNTAESAEICWLTINWKGRLRTSDKSGQLQ
jgi:hypothetical protein